jgi:hypothetical protein
MNDFLTFDFHVFPFLVSIINNMVNNMGNNRDRHHSNNNNNNNHSNSNNNNNNMVLLECGNPNLLPGQQEAWPIPVPIRTIIQ